jgi:hypothetical protein
MTAAITTDELDRLSRGIVAMPGRLIVTGLYIGCLVLDVIWQISPTNIARFADLPPKKWTGLSCF